MFPQFILANIVTPLKPTSSLLLSSLDSPSSTDTQNAKYLEDFYWAFRNQNLSWMSTSLKRFSPKSSELAKYKPVLSFGHKLAQNISNDQIKKCDQISGFDYISSKFYRLFNKICVQEKITSILNSRSLISVDTSNRTFLHRHHYILKRKRYRNSIFDKISHSSSKDKAFFSDYIKKYIYKYKKLPHSKFMSFVSVDADLTQFIQANSLFDKHDSRFFTKEFKRLISVFRTKFLNSDNVAATSALTNAMNFYNNNEEKINNAKAWKLFFLNGKRAARKDDSQELALSLFKYSEKIAEEDNLYDSKFHTLLTLYQTNQLSKAITFIKSNEFIKDFDKLTPQLRFWTAYILDKRNENVTAKKLYLKLISLSPLNYYSILSLKQLRDTNNNYNSDIIVKSDSFDGINNISLKPEALKKLQLFTTFSNAKSSFLSSLQGYELRRLSPSQLFQNKTDQTISNKNNFLLSFFSDRQEYLLSFKQAYRALRSGKIELTSNVISGLFPQIYKNTIKEQKSSLDPMLVLSLIRQESAFNSKAKSVVGARGLMQLMPSTARMFKRRLRTSQLYNPDLNIRIGTKYLQRLVKRYDGDLMFTLSAYNAGMGNVSKWKKSIPFTDDILLNVELIPFNETKKYVKLIYRNLFFYRYLDQDASHLDLKIADTFKVSYNQTLNLK